MVPYSICREVHMSHTQLHWHMHTQSGLALQGQNHSAILHWWSWRKIKDLCIAMRGKHPPVARTWVWIPLGSQVTFIAVAPPERSHALTFSSFPASCQPFYLPNLPFSPLQNWSQWNCSTFLEVGNKESQAQFLNSVSCFKTMVKKSEENNIFLT